jgi:cobalt-zinc-cadmium efflux system membrane fusion protein
MHRPIDSSFRSARWLRDILVLGICVLAALGLAGCHSEKKSAEESAQVKIEGDKIDIPPGAPQSSTFVVEAAKPIEKTILHFTGRLIWNEKKTVPVFSSVAGRVHEIPVNLQQYVSQGDTLATMESPDFGQAQADASKADADMRFSQRTLNRVRDLFEHGAAAQKDVEAAQDDFENKKAELQRAMARLKLYGVGIETTVNGMFPLKSPLSGIVVEKRINPGQEVRPDQILANDPNVIKPLFVISDPKVLTVVLDVTELDIAGLKPGQPLQVHTRAYPGRDFNGKLEVIGDSLDPLTRTVNVRGYVDNESGLLKAEMYVGVDVALTADSAEETAPQGGAVRAAKSSDPTHSHAGPPVEIPVKAVFTKDNQHFVFVEKSPGQYERQLVELGSEHAGRVAVTNGLAPGARVVTEGSLQLEAMAEGAKE